MYSEQAPASSCQDLCHNNDLITVHYPLHIWKDHTQIHNFTITSKQFDVIILLIDQKVTFVRFVDWISTCDLHNVKNMDKYHTDNRFTL